MTTFTTGDRIEAEQSTTPKSFWNNRVVKITTEYGQGEVEVVYELCEVYYNDDGTPAAWCSACLLGDTLEELKTVYKRLAEALDQPALDSTTDFKAGFEYGEEAK